LSAKPERITFEGKCELEAAQWEPYAGPTGGALVSVFRLLISYGLTRG